MKVKILRSHGDKPSFLSCDSQCTITTWLLKNGYPIQIQQVATHGPIADIQYSPLRDVIAIGLTEGLMLRANTSAVVSLIYQVNVISDLVHDAEDGEEADGDQMTITCLQWSPDSHVILVGTSRGTVVEMTPDGTVISVTEYTPHSILLISWMRYPNRDEGLAILPRGRKLFVMSSWTDCRAMTLLLFMDNGCAKWSPSQSLLAVSGCMPAKSQTCLRVLSKHGELLAMKTLPVKVRKRGRHLE